MSKKVNIVIDTIGGDNGAGFCVNAAVNRLQAYPDLSIYLTGHEKELRQALEGKEYDKTRLFLVEAPEEISLNEAPVKAVREKKDSSLVKGLRLVKDDTCDAFISAGSTGAVLAGGQLIVGRAKGVKRTPLAPVLPTAGKPSLIIDCGANVDAKPEVLVQFAKMGSIYMENVCGVKNPSVALVNIGVEEEKGNAQVKETFPLLKACRDINFIGSIEARDIPFGKADVIVTDAFVGNVIIKMYEGVAKMIFKEVKGAVMSGTASKVGGLLIKKPLKSTLSKFNASNKGGAPLLGLKGLVMKIHGNSREPEMESAIDQAIRFVEEDVTGKIIRGFETEEAQEEKA